MQDDTTREIPLTKGKVAVVDAADYEELIRYSWHAVIRNGGVYAHRYDNRLRRGFYMHRHLLGLQHGDKRQGDHKNGDTLDYRRENLRIATPSQNKTSSHRLRQAVSGFRGVTIRNHRDGHTSYRASIKINGKQQQIGAFDSKVKAARAYDEKAKELFGEFAVLNFPR